MTTPALTAAQLVTAPVAAGALGSVVAAVRRPSPSVTSALQHVAAGVVMAAVAGEVLPDHVIMFFAGFLFLYALEGIH